MISFVLENLAAAWQRGGFVAQYTMMWLVIGILLKIVWHIRDMHKAKEERALVEARRKAAEAKEKEQFMLRLRVERKVKWL